MQKIFFIKLIKGNFFFCLVVLILLILGVYLRLQGLADRGLEYDEFWSHTHYAHSSFISIFTDLSTPNNHPLNSSLIKISVALFSYSNLAIRLPVFFAGIALLFTIPLTTHLLTRSRVMLILSLAIVAFNGGLIHYAQTARGYSLQCFCISTFILSIILTETRGGKYPFIAYFLFIFPILSILTLSTSVMFIFPISLLHMIYLYNKYHNSRERQTTILRELASKNPGVLISYSILTVFVLFWYFYNFHAFKEGACFGTKISSTWNFYLFLKTTCFKIAIPLIWIMATLAFLERKWRIWLLRGALIIVVPFIIALLTVSGPPRVYLPIICVMAVSAPIGMHVLFERIRYKKLPVALCCFFLVLFLYQQGLNNLEIWTPPDWSMVAKRFYQSVKKDTFIAFPVNAGLAIFANLKGVPIIENVERLPHGDEHFFLQVGDCLAGTTPSTKTISLKLPDRYKIGEGRLGESFQLYQLRNILLFPNSEFKNKEFLFVSILPTNIGESSDIPRAIIHSIPGAWITCNPWFERGISDKNNRLVLGRFMIGQVSQELDLTSLKTFALKEKNKVKFYFLSKPK